MSKFSYKKERKTKIKDINQLPEAVFYLWFQNLFSLASKFAQNNNLQCFK